MEKKNVKKLAFEIYRKGYIGRLFKEEIKPILQKYGEEINAFRKEWLLEARTIKTEQDYQSWLNVIENRLKSKKTDIAYFEEEEGLTLNGYDVTAIELFTLMEENPRILPQGNSPRSVFDYRLRQLMRKLGIDPDWYGLFLNYLFTGEINLELISHPNIEVTERFMFGPESDELDHRITLNVGPNTRLDDVKKVWRFVIEPLQKKTKAFWKGKVRKKPTMETAMKMLELQKQGKTITQILKIIDTEGLRWDEIKARKAIDRVKKRLQK